MGNISKNLAIISIILSCLVVVRILMQDRSITYTEEAFPKLKKHTSLLFFFKIIAWGKK